MKHNRFLLLVMSAMLLLALSVPGIYAAWVYRTLPTPDEEKIPASMNGWDYAYTITYVYINENNEEIPLLDEPIEVPLGYGNVSTENQKAQAAAVKAKGQNYEFSHWMNAGSTRLDEISVRNKDDIVLYPAFVGVYTAMFVDQTGNILASASYTKNNYSQVSGKATEAQSALEKTLDEDLKFDYWEVRVTKNNTTTKTKFSSYKFADDVNVTIYPVCTYDGDVNLIPVDKDGDGDTDEYLVGGYSNPNGQDLVRIPDYVNGIPITGINANAFSSYDGVHSVVIPKTVTTIGGNALAIDWHWINNRAGETVTIYYEGSMAEWLALEATFTDGWDDGLGGSSRIFFLNGTDQVDPSQGYLQAKLSSSWGVGESITWNQSKVTTALKNEYDNKCTCKDCNGADRPDRQYWTDVVIK